MFPVETYRKTVILKVIELPQNLVKEHNLVGSFNRSRKIPNFSSFLIFLLFSICLLSVFCSNFDTPLEVQDVH